jgi:hypothetical protein
MFIGDKEEIIDESVRELKGEPFSGGEFSMAVGVDDDHYRLNPAAAVSMTNGELFALAGSPLHDNKAFAAELIYVPRIPVDASEAEAMLGMVTVFMDATKPGLPLPRTYAGYTDQELSEPHVKVRQP